MKKSLFALFAATTLGFSSCEKETIRGEGPVVTETRDIINFHGIAGAVPGRIQFSIDPVFKVEVAAQRNILQVLRTRVNNGVLEIDFPYDVRVRSHEDIMVNISGPTIDYLKLSGSGDIDVTGNVVTNSLDMDVSGAGSISVQHAEVIDKIRANISGSGDIRIAGGSVKDEELHISGNGDMDLSGIAGETGEVHISGSGNTRVNISQRLDVHISGSGSVLYRGTPTINTHISGSGNVKPL